MYNLPVQLNQIILTNKKIWIGCHGSTQQMLAAYPIILLYNLRVQVNQILLTTKKKIWIGCHGSKQRMLVAYPLSLLPLRTVIEILYLTPFFLGWGKDWQIFEFVGHSFSSQCCCSLFVEDFRKCFPSQSLLQLSFLYTYPLRYITQKAKEEMPELNALLKVNQREQLRNLYL